MDCGYGGTFGQLRIWKYFDAKLVKSVEAWTCFSESLVSRRVLVNQKGTFFQSCLDTGPELVPIVNNRCHHLVFHCWDSVTGFVSQVSEIIKLHTLYCFLFLGLVLHTVGAP